MGAEQAGGKPGLQSSLGMFGALALSVALIGPALSVSFNVKLTAESAGQAVPLSFALGSVAIVLTALSVVAFARRISSAGSVAAYVASVFGGRAGFLTGWMLLLAYLLFATLVSALAGYFGAAALAHAGANLPGSWLAIGIAAAVLAILLGGREIKLLTALMLAIEGLVMLAVLALAAVVLARVPWSAAPFVPDADKGLSGIGYGVTFAVLSFAGFEGAASLAEETRDPRRAIPWALFGSVAVVGLVYVVVSYAVMLGFGTGAVADLMRSEAPLDTLSTRFISGAFGAALDAMAAISGFGCALGAISAGARILFAMSRAGLDGGLGFDAVDERHGAPRRAAVFLGVLSLLGLLAIAPWVGPEAYASAASTVGGISAVAIYVTVCAAQVVAAVRDGRRLSVGLGLCGVVGMGWPLFSSLSPSPPWPGVVWPLMVAAWLAVGAGMSVRLGSRLREGAGLDEVAAPSKL